MAPRIGFTGDVLVGRDVDDRQRRRPADALWGPTLERVSESNERFVLELPPNEFAYSCVETPQNTRAGNSGFDAERT